MKNHHFWYKNMIRTDEVLQPNNLGEIVGSCFTGEQGRQFLNIPACQEILSAVKRAQIIVLEEQYMLSFSFVTLQLAFCKKAAACT